ncbi:MAG: hypothetical protein EB075_11765, partial [Bacteroidetes bacterium]|nr:hypothetical protein [Bacteroidota bacterium]
VGYGTHVGVFALDDPASSTLFEEIGGIGKECLEFRLDRQHRYSAHLVLNSSMHSGGLMATGSTF